MRKYLYFTVFISGFTSLGLEMAASRLLERHFGASNLVWASIIGLILIYLSIGYLLGGKWADRSPVWLTFYRILLWASVSIALIPLISRPVLQIASNAFDHYEMSVLLGSFISVMFLLLVPTVLLGTASPFAIRLLVHRSSTVGSISGQLYAISTLGSFVGTFIPVLILIPWLGTYRSFLALSGLLMTVTIVGIGLTSGWRRALQHIWAPILLVCIALWGLPGTDRQTSGMLYETESAYNYIQVLENKDGYRVLRLNEGQGMHSMYHPNILNYYGPWEMVLVAPYFNPAPVAPQMTSLAIVGLAGGTTARQATLVYGPIPIDGIEIDARITNVARTYFDLNQPNLNIINQDGRWALEHSRTRYQVISLDAYRPPYIPWHLTTREFFQSVYAHLTPDGVLAINVGRSPGDNRMVEAFVSTLKTVFPSVHVVNIPRTFNSVVYATVQPTLPQNLADNLALLQDNPMIHSLLKDTLVTAVANLQPPSAPGLVLTDDRAPVEWITNDMIFRFIFSGKVETLQ